MLWSCPVCCARERWTLPQTAVQVSTLTLFRLLMRSCAYHGGRWLALGCTRIPVQEASVALYTIQIDKCSHFAAFT